MHLRGSGWTFEAIEKVSNGAESFFQQVLPDMLALDTALAEGGGRAEGEAGVVEQFKSNPVPRISLITLVGNRVVCRRWA